MKNKVILFLFLGIYFLIISFNNTNPTRNEDKLALGKKLFFDNNLSYNKTKACASCHDPKFAFTDGYKKSIGIDGFNVLHNATGLQNVALNATLTWSDSSIKTLKEQLQFPFFNHTPNELGWHKNEAEMIERISNLYAKEIKFIYKKKNISIPEIFECIAVFESSLISFNSSYDKFIKGNNNALSLKAKAGMKLFFSKELNCASCHKGKNLGAISAKDFYNIGLYNIDEEGSYPNGDNGLYEKNKNLEDKGKFRVPNLRNVALTAPYTHDGSVLTLSEMIDIYSKGGRNISTLYHKGNGILNKNKSVLVKGFSITPEQKINLISFLESLTDDTFIKKYSDEKTVL